MEMPATGLDSLILNRRSIRKFRQEQPPDSCIEKMIFAASHAPSHSNTQPVRFFRIRNEEKRAALRHAMQEGRDQLLKINDSTGLKKRTRNWIRHYWRFSEFMLNAPVLLAVGVVNGGTAFHDRLVEAKIVDSNPFKGRDKDICMGLSLKGLILKGVELGVGTCILTAPLSFLPSPENLLGIIDVTVRCYIAAGFPDEIPVPVKKLPVSEIYKEI